MTIAGGLIAESLRLGTVLADVHLSVTRISRADIGDVDAGQPRTWTFIDFEADDEEAERFAAMLERSLTAGAWYCDFRSEHETFVVFSGRTFRYPRGDVGGRRAAEDYGRSVGVPAPQLDWPE